jgi:hypothetical protein
MRWVGTYNTSRRTKEGEEKINLFVNTNSNPELMGGQY